MASDNRLSDEVQRMRLPRDVVTASPSTGKMPALPYPAFPCHVPNKSAHVQDRLTERKSPPQSPRQRGEVRPLPVDGEGKGGGVFRLWAVCLVKAMYGAGFILMPVT